MRSIGTMKNLPAKTTIDGAYRNKSLGLISFVVNGEAVLTVQDKNFGATDYFQYIRLDGRDVNTIPETTGSNYKRQNGETIQEQLEDQSLIPDGYHVFNNEDYDKIRSIIGNDKQARFSFSQYYRMLIPYTPRCPIGTDAPIGTDYYGCGRASGETMKRANAYEPYQIRLTKDEIVEPLSNRRWQNITNINRIILTTSMVVNEDLTTNDYGLTFTTNYDPSTDEWISGTGYYIEINDQQKCIKIPAINSDCVYYFYIYLGFSSESTSPRSANIGLRIIGTNNTRLWDGSNKRITVGFWFREDDFEQRKQAFKNGQVEIYFDPKRNLPSGFTSYNATITSLQFKKTA